MSVLSGFLKLEVAKYKDIDHILKKLEDDGEIQNVYGVFKNIFDNELQFTVGGTLCTLTLFDFIQP